MNQPSLKKMKVLFKAGKFEEVARWLPHRRHDKDAFIKFLMASNLLRMKDHLLGPAITLGADPEFILCEPGKPDKIINFSSQYTTDYFGLSEAMIGADYGLLEFRPEPAKTPAQLVKEIRKLHTVLAGDYKDFQILEKEAVAYNHKRARTLESMNEKKDINYGMDRGKDIGVWGADTEITMGMESGVSLSAYDKPMFNQFNDNLFTAGGHIHVGGVFVMLLSIDQLKAFVRRLDKLILPICAKVETEAAELRKEVYGAIGEFRIKNYGIEYRSPSNAIFWQKNLKTLLEVLQVVDGTVRSMAVTAQWR